MSKELVISANRHETRVAVIEDDQVVEVYHQRENEYSLAGSIHKGRVTRVLPGMQSAFVDIGLDRDAFLYVSDFFEDNEEYDKIVTSVEDKVFKLDRPSISVPVAALPPIAAPPAETVEPVEVRSSAPEASPPPVEAAAPPSAAAPPAPAPGQDQRRDGRDGRDDRDRRGRRSRRRRGQKGGGRLPDSKFYSPGPRGGTEESAPPRPTPVESAATPAPATAPPRVESGDDFFVLPGESLAKYSRPGSEEDEESREEAAFETDGEESAFEEEPAGMVSAEEPSPEWSPSETLVEVVAVGETDAGEEVVAVVEIAEAPVASEIATAVSEIAEEPVAEPPAELAEAMEEVQESVAEEAAETAAAHAETQTAHTQETAPP